MHPGVRSGKKIKDFHLDLSEISQTWYAKFGNQKKSNCRFIGFWTSLARIWGPIWFSGLPSIHKYQN